MWGNCVSFREEPPANRHVLANGCLEATGEIFQREKASSAQRPDMTQSEPSMAPDLG